MSIMNWVGLVLSVVLGVYLFVALLLPEKFVVTPSQLITEVWGPDRLGDTRNLRVCLKSLRQKIEPNPSQPQFIITEIGLGYRLRTAEVPEARG